MATPTYLVGVNPPAVPGGPLQQTLVLTSDISGGSSVSVNGTPVSNPDFTNGDILFDASGAPTIKATVHALATTGASVVIDSSAPPSHQGQLLISQPGNTSAAWADPFVQGPWVNGTAIVSPGAMGDGTSNIQPVFVAGYDGTNMRGFLTDSSGRQIVNINGTVSLASAGTPGSAAPATAVQIAGTDGANLRALSTDTSGKLNVNATFSGTVSPSLPPDRTASGTITSTQSITLSLTAGGGGTVAFNVTGTWTGTLVFEASIDGTNWVSAYAIPFQFATLSNSTIANGQWVLNAGGLNAFRVRGNSVSSGTATVWIEVGAGSNAGVIMDIVQGTISVTNFPATQTVAGTVTAAQGTPNVVANAWPVEVTDGTNILMTSTHPGIVNIQSNANVNVHDGGGTSISSTNDSGTVGLNVHLTNTGGISGTQYVQGTTVATPTGTMAMGWYATGTVAESLRLDSSYNLLVNVNTPLPAGTNLLGKVEVSDGTNTLFTTAHPGITQDVSDGTPSATAPATALEVGGVDSGGKLRALSTDSSGVLNVNAAVSGTFTPALTSDRTATGTLTAVNDAVTLSTQGTSSTVFNVLGTWVGTISFEVSIDGSNWYPVTAYAKFPSGAAQQTTSANGQFQVPTGGVNSLRLRASAWTSGTATVWIEGGAGPLVIEVGQVTASNLKATVTQGQGGGISNAWAVEITDGANILGTTAHPVKVDGSGVTQPVSFSGSLPTGTNSIGYVGYTLPNSSRLTQVPINVSGSGQTALVSGIGGQTIRVFRMFFIVGGSTTVKLQDASSDLTGPMSFTTGGGMVLDLSGEPWYVTGSGNAFNINSTSAVQISGTVYYTQS